LSTTAVDGWAGEDVRVDDVERALARLRGGDAGTPQLRTSVMTHIAWVPPEWVDTARATLAALDERYPSRTILLLARPDDGDGIDARVETQCFPAGGGHHVATEVVELTLRGSRAQAPASVVAPLLLPDLPVFLRWRGRPPFGEPTFERLARLVDRLVVDSREWDDPVGGFERLAAYFGPHLAVSDIVWARTFPWRVQLAHTWPSIGALERLAVWGPEPDALLLAGWLRSRLGRPIALEHEFAQELARVVLDGREADPPAEPAPTDGELLSAELDRFARDLVYEAAVLAAGD
jgi:glucose-6-phosphate dehydrogenase assembly protein OpcA